MKLLLDCTPQEALDYWQNREKNAIDMFEQFIIDNAEELKIVARWGDGKCGYLADIMIEHLIVEPPERKPNPRRDHKITPAIKKKVFERDAYRCNHCESYIDLTVDHIYPISLGGKTEMDNLQTLCRSCNCRKGAKV